MDWSVIRPIPMLATESVRVEFKAIPRNKVYQQVAKRLERRIAEELKPGDLLPPERELVRMLGVSRGSVRDAIRTPGTDGPAGAATGHRHGGLQPQSQLQPDPLAAALLEKRKMIAELARRAQDDRAGPGGARGAARLAEDDR